MVVIGTTLSHQSSGTYYSPWFPRQGNAATFSLELIAQSSASIGITVTVETKNQDEKDSSADPVTGTLQTDDIGVVSLRFEGFLELVRFKYVVKGGATLEDWGHFQMLNPSWETN